MESAELASLVLIAAAAVAGPLLADGLRRFLPVPSLLIEVGLGIAIGPAVFALASTGPIIDSFARVGLVLLVFLVGFEVEPQLVRGRPIRLASVAWVGSLVLALIAAGVMHRIDTTSSVRFIAIALTTSAAAVLLPILADSGLLQTRFGAFAVTGGLMGQLGPILALAVLLVADNPVVSVTSTVVFGAITAAAIFAATRPARPRLVQVIGDTLQSTGQVAVRIAVLICIALIWAAAESNINVLFGAFTGGIVARLFLVGHSTPLTALPADPVRVASPQRSSTALPPVDPSQSRSRYSQIQDRIESFGHGFFIPLFFVVSGMRLDVRSWFDGRVAVLIPVFVVLFVVVRGLPVVLYRRDLPRRELLALAFMQSAALPMLVVVTSFALARGEMNQTDAAALVGAGLISVVVFPFIGLALQRSAGSTSPTAGPHQRA